MSDRKVIVFSGHNDDFNLLDEKRMPALPVDDLRKNGLVANVGDGRKAPWNQPIFRLY